MDTCLWLCKGQHLHGEHGRVKMPSRRRCLPAEKRLFLTEDEHCNVMSSRQREQLQRFCEADKLSGVVDKIHNREDHEEKNCWKTLALLQKCADVRGAPWYCFGSRSPAVPKPKGDVFHNWRWCGETAERQGACEVRQLLHAQRPHRPNLCPVRDVQNGAGFEREAMPIFGVAAHPD